MKSRNNSVVTIEEIKEIIDRRSLESQINEGFDDQQEEHFTYIEVFHGDTKLMLDLAGEYTIYFGDWHGHYYTDEKHDMREFRQVLEDLLDSKICSVGCFRERDGVENWCGSSIEFRENLDRDYFQRKYGGDRIIRCRFFDETLNRVFMT